jgi:hypothetical protein
MTPPEMNSLPREVTPPPELEARVVSALRAEGLLRPTTTISWMHVAAALVLLAVGIFIGRAWPQQPSDPIATSDPRFLFLLTEADTSGDDAARAEAYRQWAVQQRDAGRQISGERLADSGVAVVRRGELPIARAEVQGFFVVSASTLDEAVTVARSSPHVQSGGTIIVRQIDTP